MEKRKYDSTVAREGWAKWYREAREDMAFRFGRRRMAKDRYKVQHSLGASPTQAAKAIDQELLNEYR